MTQGSPQALLEGRAEQAGGDDRRQRGGDHVPPVVRVHDERDERPERHHLTVGEVRQAGGAEDERQADRRDGDDHRQLQAVGERLGQQAPLALHVARALAEKERTGHVLVPADFCGLRVLAVLYRQTLGQGFGVDANDVGPRLVDRDQIHAVFVGDRLADHVAALVLGHDAHIGHGFPLAVLRAILHAPGDRLSGLVLLGVGLSARGQAAEQCQQHDPQCGQDAGECGPAPWFRAHVGAECYTERVAGAVVTPTGTRTGAEGAARTPLHIHTVTTQSAVAPARWAPTSSSGTPV